MDPTATDMSVFTHNFNRECSAARGGDSFVNSPFSVAATLALVHAGAGGATADQIGRLFGVGDSETEAFHDSFRRLVSGVAALRGVTVSVANALYVAHTMQLLPEYTALAERVFSASVDQVDFSDSTAASGVINGRVEQITCGKIKDLVDASTLNDSIKAVLVNAVYFRGNWKRRFLAENTQSCDFFVSDNTSVLVQMMAMENVELRAASIDSWSCLAVELPYEQEDFTMLILLPSGASAMHELEHGVDGAALADIRSQLAPRTTSVWLPKFTVQTEFDLKALLMGLRVEHLFSAGEADLSRMARQPGLFVSRAVHRACVEVGEWGCEAAAASAMHVMLRCARPSPAAFQFRADRPFLFYIISDVHRTVLFSGKFAGGSV